MGTKWYSSSDEWILVEVDQVSVGITQYAADQLGDIVFIDLPSPDFVKWAEAMGCVGIRVESPEEVEPAIALANSINDRSVVVEFRVDAGEKVFPMVPAGFGNDDVLLHPNQNDRREFLR